MTRYTVGLTIAVEAETDQLAIETAREAGMSLQGREGVAGAAIDVEALPLFDDGAFRQMRGQTALDTD